MKRYKYLSLLIVLLIVFVMISQGCGRQTINANSMQSGNQQQKVSKDDLDTVNEYLKGIGENEITLDVAEVMDQALYENTQTQGQMSDWQFIVIYARNEKSERPVQLSYSVEFINGTVSMNLGSGWKRVEPHPEASQEELDIVNEYLQGIGSKEMTLEDAKSMNHWLMENSKTREIKSDWQILVEYIRNEKSESPATLDYTIEFGKEDISFQLDNTWEYIGG